VERARSDQHRHALAGIQHLGSAPEVKRRDYADIIESAFYWYFVVLIWLPLYVVIYWVPRLQ
jgi:heme/copper-type cytochrome/quinol oxidase subunit 3